jgi:hypothetical protein
MTFTELRVAAIECLAKAFKGDHSIPAQVIQAAVSILTIEDPSTR